MGAGADVVVHELIMTLAGLGCVVFSSKFANGESWKECPSVADKSACVCSPLCMCARPRVCRTCPFLPSSTCPWTCLTLPWLQGTPGPPSDPLGRCLWDFCPCQHLPQSSSWTIPILRSCFHPRDSKTNPGGGSCWEGTDGQRRRWMLVAQRLQQHCKGREEAQR